MELYLLHNDSAIVLTKPGLFELTQSAGTNSTPVNATPQEAPNVDVQRHGAANVTDDQRQTAVPVEAGRSTVRVGDSNGFPRGSRYRAYYSGVTDPQTGTISGNNQDIPNAHNGHPLSRVEIWDGTGDSAHKLHTYNVTQTPPAVDRQAARYQVPAVSGDAGSTDTMGSTITQGQPIEFNRTGGWGVGTTFWRRNGTTGDWAQVDPVTFSGGDTNREIALIPGGATGTGAVQFQIREPGQSDGQYTTLSAQSNPPQGGTGTVSGSGEVPNGPTANPVHADTPDGQQAATVTRNMAAYERTTEQRMGQVFSWTDPDNASNNVRYWGAGTDFTRPNVDSMTTALTTRREALVSQREGTEGTPQYATLTREITWLDDRIARSGALAPIAGEFDSARTSLSQGNWEPGRDFIRNNGTTVQGLGNQSVTSAYLDTGRRVSDTQPVAEQHVSGRGRGGQMGSQTAAQALRGVADGVHAFGDVIDAGSRVGYGVANLGNSASAIDRAFGGQGFSNPGIYGRGGFGGMGMMGMMGIGGQYGMDEESAYESNRLRSLLMRLMHAIRSGDTDAIGQALTIVGLMSRKTLQKTAMLAIRSMSQLQGKMEDNNNQIAGLNSDGNPQYASQLQFLSNRMQGYNMDRQAIVSLLRQVKAADDEIWNTDKAWKDVHLRQLRQWSTWNA